MELLLIFLTNIFFIIYSAIDGMKEAFCKNYDESSKKINNFRVKKLFNIQRVIVYLIMLILMFQIIGIPSFIFITGQILMFSYFQKMFFNITYNKINPMNVNLEIDTKKKISFIIGVIIQVITLIIF